MRARTHTKLNQSINQLKWVHPAWLLPLSNLALEMVASLMLLANTDEWKNHSDSQIHLLWYSHVNAAERNTVNREAIDRNMAQYVCVSASGVCDEGGLEGICPCVCVCMSLNTKMYCKKPNLVNAGCRDTGCLLLGWFAGFCFGQYLFGSLKNDSVGRPVFWKQEGS